MASPVSTDAAAEYLSLPERTAAFEAYILRKVREQVDSAIASAPLGHSSSGPSPNTSRDSAATRRRGVGPSAGLRIAVEAAKGKAAALEHRQVALEAKVNALVSDFVLTSQANKREMVTFGADLARKYKALHKAVLAAAPQASAVSAHEDPHGPTLKRVMVEQQESGQRMREFVGVIALMRREMEEDRQALRESQAQTYAVMERIIERVNAMDEDIAVLMDRQDAFEGVCNELRELTGAQQERIAQLEQHVHQLRQQESAQNGNQARLTAMVDTAYNHQKNHESAVSQKLLTLSARIEQLANNTIELDERCAILQQAGEDEQRRHQRAAQALRRSSAVRLCETNRQRLRAGAFHTWRSWQAGCDQARRDQLVLKLFAKQKSQLEEMQRKLDSLA